MIVRVSKIIVMLMDFKAKLYMPDLGCCVVMLVKEKTLSSQYWTPLFGILQGNKSLESQALFTAVY